MKSVQHTQIKKAIIQAINRAVFDLVCGDDWRGPIDVRVLFIDRHLVLDAIEYFTGATSNVTEEDTDNQHGPRMVRIKSAGYRNGPAGP